MGPQVRAPALRGFATASVSLGFFAGLVFWWHPFSLILSVVGIFCGVVSLFMGWRAQSDGDRFRRGDGSAPMAFVGTMLSLMSFTVIITMNYVIHVLLWDY